MSTAHGVDRSGVGAGSATPNPTAFVQTLLDDADAAAFLTTLGFSSFVLTVLDDANAATFRATIDAVGLTGNESVGGDKTFTGSNTFSGALTAIDTNFVILGSADSTKRIRFEADGVSAGQTRVVTVPDANVDLQYSRLATDTEAGALEIATQAEQETGSAVDKTVTPGRQQFHPSAPKCWGFFDGAAGTPTYAASYNLTGAGPTDNGAGSYTVTIATDFSSVNYAALVNVGIATDAGNFQEPAAVDKAVGSFRIDVESTAAANTDADNVNFFALGDQ